MNHAIHRDHRKIVVIDGKIGYTGGMNIADYYINGLPKIGNGTICTYILKEMPCAICRASS